jgi:hypothetical protein
MIARTLLLSLLTLVLSLNVPAFAEDDAIEKEEIAAQESADKQGWVDATKEKYNLTDEQIKTMTDKGLTRPQLAIAAQLSKSSNKPLDEILKMRTEDKMGWGKIAKELGVSPSEIGHSVSDLRHKIRDERKEERQTARKERREKHKQAREERKEDRKNGRKGK